MSDNKITIIALFGKSGAGKDTCLKWITKYFNLNTIVSCTTRPKREKEINGEDYFFLTEEEFQKEEMLETTEFRGWHYGTMLKVLDNQKANIGVFNIQGINTLLQNKKIKVIPVYIYASDKLRLMRSLSREKNPDCLEICRRFQTDEQDFSNIPFEYLIYENENKTEQDLVRFFLGHFSIN